MDEITVLNRALSNTGNNTLTVLNDGSDEWQVASLAFERAIEDLISRHNWPFAKVALPLVVAADEDNPSVRETNAYKLPTSMIHVRDVLIASAGQKVRVTDYEIVGRYVCLDTAMGIFVEGYAMPPHENFHPQATEILTLMVEAGCLRGLNEDFTAADHREATAENRLFEARPRVDWQNPAKNAFVSSVAAARRRGSGRWPLSVPASGGNSTAPDGSVLLDD